ncbi:MAG: hypothetical protein C0404_02740 [Verrucomicrobia bacterium]|nr:hypothetical protein [Verrucomicrobiota bacterium]
MEAGKVVLNKRKAILSVCAIALAIILAPGCRKKHSGAWSKSELATGGAPAMRVVWCRQVTGDATDVGAEGLELQLMGLDTKDGNGPHPIIKRTGNFHKPLITPKGDRVVYTELPQRRIFVTDWHGSRTAQVESGVAVDVWMEPGTGREWVYAINADSLKDNDAGKPVFRFLLDDPFTKETVWDKTLVNESNFQLSRDGTRACGNLPWPDVGVVDLVRTNALILGKGCWPSIAPDNSYITWIFDGPHRNLIMASADGKNKWKVAINGASGVDGWEVYHPRWGNHARYFTLTGPYKSGDGDNKIRAGGQGVEVFVGRFDETLSKVEAWLRVTSDPFLDVYPDVWVEPGVGKDDRNMAARVESFALPDAARVELKGRLAAKTAIPSLKTIAPYTQALVVYVYDVVEVKSGKLAARKILVAHWGVRNAKPVSRERKLGDVFDLKVERYEAHPELEGERVVSDVGDAGAALYYEVTQ